MAAPNAAALLQELDDYWLNTLQIQQQTVRDALHAQGLLSASDFLGLTEEDVAEICNNARKPGGTVPNPAFNPLNPVVGIAPTITNPGVLVGHVIEKRLKMMRYYIHHLMKVSRPFDPAAPASSLPNLQDLHRFKESEDEYKNNDIELPEKLTEVENIRTVLEDLDDYFERKRGVTGIPLAAYTRPLNTVPPLNLDPGYGRPSIIQELVRRAPHTGPTALTDNEAVWDAVRHVTHDGPGWGWVQMYSRNRDGRGAYRALRNHYFGDAYQTRLRAKADQTLETNYYDGSKRNFTYEKYIESLQKAFSDLESTGEFVSEERKIRILLTGIHDTRLESAKNQILASPNLRISFEVASGYLAEVLDNKVSYSATTRRARISAIQSSGNKKNNKGNNKNTPTKFDPNNPNKYYPYKLWVKLTPEQQQLVRDSRDKQNSSTKKRTASGVNSNKKKRKNNDSSSSATDTTEDSTSNGDDSSEDREAGIGAIMSQRKKRNDRV